MAFTTEGFLEVAVERWLEWDVLYIYISISISIYIYIYIYIIYVLNIYIHIYKNFISI